MWCDTSRVWFQHVALVLQQQQLLSHSRMTKLATTIHISNGVPERYSNSLFTETENFRYRFVYNEFSS